jgi:hypothetical protein
LNRSSQQCAAALRSNRSKSSGCEGATLVNETRIEFILRFFQSTVKMCCYNLMISR